MSAGGGPAPPDQEPGTVSVGGIRIVAAETASFDVVVDRFLAAPGSRSSWTLRNLERANRAFGRWLHGRIPVEEIPAIVLPFHVGGCDRNSDLPQQVHLVPPSGLVVGDAHTRLTEIRGTYRRLAPHCHGRIARGRELAANDPGTFFFSAGPLLMGSTYRGLTAFQGRLTHVDGLHRLLGLMDAEQRPDSIDAFVAVNSGEIES